MATNYYNQESPSTMKDFQIISKLGEGAFSQVYKVKRNSDKQIYALKKVKMNMLSEKEKENALNEVRILASINDPYIVQYKECFFEQNENCLCLVMEFCDGGDILQLIRNCTKHQTFVKEMDIWKYFINIVEALTTLHRMNILHRDIKCANIFISNGNAKLGDLNVSKVVKQGLVFTQTGTPYYACPEVWRDKPFIIISLFFQYSLDTIQKVIYDRLDVLYMNQLVQNRHSEEAVWKSFIKEFQEECMIQFPNNIQKSSVMQFHYV